MSTSCAFLLCFAAACLFVFKDTVAYGTLLAHKSAYLSSELFLGEDGNESDRGDQLYFVFKMAPLHHHYQKEGIPALIKSPAKALPEAKIVTRFWIVGMILAVITIALLKVR